MRYFYYTNENRTSEHTVIIIDDTKQYVTLYPQRTNYSESKRDWLDYYSRRGVDPSRQIFEICENQFNKFKNDGTTPQNWDY